MIIDWLTWEVCMWLLGILLLWAYLWADGRKLLLNIFMMAVMLVMDVYAIIICGILSPIIMAVGLILGPFARLFNRDINVGEWHVALMIKSFAMFTKFKKIEPTGEENKTYPDGFYKVEYYEEYSICPDCYGDLLLIDPEKCTSIKVKCADCGAIFNYTSFNRMLERL